MPQKLKLWYSWPKVRLLFLFVALGLGNSLLLTPEGSLSRLMGAILLLLLPGLAWFEAIELGDNQLTRLVGGLGLSYVLFIITGLLLHYLPGPISTEAVVVLLNLLTISAMVKLGINSGKDSIIVKGRGSLLILAILLVIVCFSGLLRFVNLGYSEFDGDEVKALVPSAEALEGREDALFYQRKKGPADILVPLMLWRLTGLIDERTARILFAVAGLMLVVTTYQVGWRLFNVRVGLLAAGLIGLNGFMVTFSRIVMYPQLVMWFSLLTLMAVNEWRRDGRLVWWLLIGTYFGVGVLSHYDTLLVGPALAYFYLQARSWRGIKITEVGLAGVSAFAIVALFFLPYLLAPGVSETGEYLHQRIGSGTVQNQLSEFFYVTIFYNSLYYVFIVGLLALGYLVWAVINLPAIQVSRKRQYILAGLVIVIITGLSLWPDLLNISNVDLAFVPFTLIFLGALLSPSVKLEQSVVILWLAVSFLGYNFLVASPRTHFFTIMPSLILTAALSSAWLWGKLSATYLPIVGSIILSLLFGGYLYHAFLRPEVEFETDWPDSQLALYWFPYTDMPRLDAYGFIHRHGWKAVGGLYAGNQIKGDYQSNDFQSITNWYTRHQLADGCYGQTNYFFALKHRATDLLQVADYRQIAEINLPTGKGINIYQIQSLANSLGSLFIDSANETFDQTAYPAAFVRPFYQTAKLDVKLVGGLHLTRYSITLPDAQPSKQMAVTLNWELDHPIPFDLRVFVHLEDEQGNIWGQSDSQPACGKQPTSTWLAEQVIEDTHIIQISPNALPGVYILQTGLYLPPENMRVPLIDKRGQPTSQNSIILTTVAIR